MICTLLIAALAGSYRSALAWADRLLAHGEPGYQQEDALEAYRQVAHVYGPRNEIRRREARCLIALGDYASAAIDAPLNSRERRVASSRLRLGLKVAQIVRRPALFVDPVNGRVSTYAVLTGKRIRNPYPPPDWMPPVISDLKLCLVRCDPPGGPRVLSTRAISERGDPNPTRSVSLHCTSLWAGGPAVVCVHKDIPAGDCDPTSDELFRVGSKSLVPLGKFSAIYGNDLHPPSSRHRLFVVNRPTWKVVWEDAYDWTDRGFQLSNARHPELYSIEDCLKDIRSESGRESGSTPFYADYEWLAATLDIHHQFARALAAWKKAERLCERTVRTGSSDAFIGDAPINLLEIRQRIRWLRKGQHDHWLLYRPYDWDLQIPPWNLARGHRSAVAIEGQTQPALQRAP